MCSVRLTLSMCCVLANAIPCMVAACCFVSGGKQCSHRNDNRGGAVQCILIRLETVKNEHEHEHAEQEGAVVKKPTRPRRRMIDGSMRTPDEIRARKRLILKAKGVFISPLLSLTHSSMCLFQATLPRGSDATSIRTCEFVSATSRKRNLSGAMHRLMEKLSGP